MLPAVSHRTAPMPKTRDFPRYFQWRDGRPRWEPGPTLRRAGHKGQDLKNPDGAWLGMWDACKAADVINAAIETGLEAPRVALPTERTMGALIDLVEALPKFKDDGGAGKRLAHSTVINYQSHHRIIRAWAGDIPVRAIKGNNIAVFYDAMIEERGLVMANRVLSSLSRLFNYAVDVLDWLPKNPARGVELATEDGRLVIWTPAETLAFVRCADWMGFDDIADAHIIGLMTSQRRSDILPLPELEPRDGCYPIVQSKTGRTAYVPETAVLTARLALARRRKAERFPGVTYRHELVSLRTGAPFSRDGSTFTHEYRMVRAVASGLQSAIDQFFPKGAGDIAYHNKPFDFTPSIWDKRFQDLRDTGVTLLYDLTKGDEAKTANISGHSLQTVRQIIDKHYFVRQAELSRGAGRLVDAYMEKIGFAG
jgi:integrase